MRRDLAVVGAGLIVLGAASVVGPGVGVDVSSGAVAATYVALGVAVALVGVVVATVPSGSAGERDASRVGLAVRLSGRSSREPSGRYSREPSGRGTGRPRPADDLVGAEFDATLDRLEQLSSVELRATDDTAALRDRLREAAVATVATRAGVGRETASELVRTGSWTDDPVAAAFLSESVEVPRRVRLYERLSSRPRVVTRARRTAAALEAEL